MTEPRRVLVLSPFPPRLDATHGGSRSIAHLVLALTERNRVGLAFLRAEDEEGLDQALAVACERVHEGRRAGVTASSVRPWSRSGRLAGGLFQGKPLWVAARWNADFAARVREIALEWRPHVVQAEFGAMGQYLGHAAASGARTVATVHEPGTAAARERSRVGGIPSRMGWLASAHLWAGYERGLLRSAAATVVFTDRDAKTLTELQPGARVVTIPLGVAVPPLPSDPAGASPPVLLFVGNYLHPPNLSAARRLAEQILPRLTVAFPSLRLRLVGDNAPRSLLRLADDRIDVTGRVPDVRPYLDEATIFLAPLAQGGGMRVKVLEAMAAGKAVIASPTAAEGLDASHREHLMIARTDDEFVQTSIMLLEDEALRVRLGRAARRWTQQNRTWERTAAAYEALYDAVGAGGASLPATRESSP